MEIVLNSTAIVNLRAVSGITTGTLYVRRDGTTDDLRVSANADMSAYTNLQSNVEQVFTGDAYALGWGKLSVSSTTNKYSTPTVVQPVYYGADSGLTAGGEVLEGVGGTSAPQVLGKPNEMFTKYGVRAYDTCAAGISIGATTLTHVLSNERPRFQTYTRKCTLSSAASEIRFASASFTADPIQKALSIDIYIEQMPSEFLGTSNPYITVQVSNTTGAGSNFSRWTFDSGYLRQGWNTLKMHQADTVTSTSNAGNLPIGVSHPSEVGTGFDWLAVGQFFSLTFSNMAGYVIHIDELRRPAKAMPVLTIGFDASGFNATDEIFVTKVAPMFAQYGVKGYCTMTNVYELIYSGSQAWTRVGNLYNNFDWDVINHTWSHGGTDVGRVATIASLVRTSNVVTATVTGGHGLAVGKVVKGAIQGATGTPGADMNTDATLAMPDLTVTSSTVFTYPSVGTNGTATGTPKLYTFLSEIFTVNNAENLRLLRHELSDVQRILKASGFAKSLPFAAMPNNSVPELSLMNQVCDENGLKFVRAYRGGMTFVNEFGIDNPRNMGAYAFESGSNFTRLSMIKAKVLSAIDRGEHIHLFGHFIMDDEDPANAAYAPVDPDYPPGQGGNPAAPAAGLSGIGGWWYLSQLRSLFVDTIGPALAAKSLRSYSASEYSNFMGEI